MNIFRNITLVLALFPMNAAAAAPADNLQLMMLIKATCDIDPPAGVYQRELERHLTTTGQNLTDALMEIGTGAVQLRAKVGEGSEGIFCEDVRKTHGSQFYGD